MTDEQFHAAVELLTDHAENFDFAGNSFEGVNARISLAGFQYLRTFGDDASPKGSVTKLIERIHRLSDELRNIGL